MLLDCIHVMDAVDELTQWAFGTLLQYTGVMSAHQSVAASLAVFQMPCFPLTVSIANLLRLCITFLQMFTHMLVNQAVLWQ